jgi:hypothetical protein
MLPEPFLQALSGSVDVVAWLRELLGSGSPNAVHYLLATLSRAGAAVWTVNFDELIERAGGSGIEISKPHGTLSGQMVFTSDDVLRGLSPEWEAKLRASVSGRIALFIGYSGNDLDFRPIWDDVLRSADHVVWYVFGTDDASTREAAERHRIAGWHGRSSLGGASSSMSAHLLPLTRSTIKRSVPWPGRTGASTPSGSTTAGSARPSRCSPDIVKSATTTATAASAVF